MTRTYASVRALSAAAVLAALALGPVPFAVGQPSPEPTVGGALAPGLAAQLDAMGDGDVTTVLVSLTGRLDPTPPPGLPTAARHAAVVQRLRDQARVAQAPLRARLAALGRAGGVMRSEPFWVADAVALTATAPVIRELAARPDVASVRPDALTVTPAGSTPWNVTATGAPTLWAGGDTGEGAVVAVVDSGVDLSHPDLAARWRGGSNSWFDPFDQHATPVDISGHGTGAAGIIAGGDASDAYGVAPGATWIAARVFDDAGTGSVTAMHRVFQWLLDPDGDPATDDAPDVVNASWVLGSGPSCDLVLQPDVQALRAAGILPVFAAGNFGPSGSSSASPANYPESLSVGAVDDQDRVWAYTSSGPSTCGGRHRVFPDLVAPGVGVTTADRYGTVQTLTGTSVAAPHVAGALAVLTAAHPSAGPALVESALTGSAVDLGTSGPDSRYGNGRIDLVAADAVLRAAPGPADLALALAPTSVTVSRGATGSAVLSLTVLSGSPGPATLAVGTLPRGVAVAVSPGVVGVPGTATVTIQVDRKARKGSYDVGLTATAGSLTRSVSLSVVVR